MKSREALNLAESPSINIPPAIKRDRKHPEDNNNDRDRGTEPPPPKRSMSTSSLSGELPHPHNLHNQQLQKQINQVATEQKHQIRRPLNMTQDETDTQSDMSLSDNHNASVDELTPSRRTSTPHRNGTSHIPNESPPTTNNNTSPTMLSGMQFKITSRGKNII